MANWLKPDQLSDYATEVLQTLNDKMISLASMTYGSDTNVPAGAKRLNTTNGRIEQNAFGFWLNVPLEASKVAATDVEINGTNSIDLQKDGTSKLEINDNVEAKSHLILPDLATPTAQSGKAVLYSHDGRLTYRDDASNVHMRRSGYTISTYPSNRVSGGSVTGYKCYFGDLVYVNIMISSYTASAGTSLLTWSNVLPEPIVGNRVAFAAQVYGGYSGFRWLPLTARCDSGQTLSLARHDGGAANNFASGTTWIVIAGSYFWK